MTGCSCANPLPIFHNRPGRFQAERRDRIKGYIARALGPFGGGADRPGRYKDPAVDQLRRDAGRRSLVGSIRLAARQIDDPAMQRAHHDTAADGSFRERGALMRAAVDQGKDPVVGGAKDRNRVGLARRPLDPPRAFARDVLDPADFDPALVRHRSARLCPDRAHQLVDHPEPRFPSHAYRGSIANLDASETAYPWLAALRCARCRRLCRNGKFITAAASDTDPSPRLPPVAGRGPGERKSVWRMAQA